MTSQTRDTIALFAIGSLAALVVLLADSDLEQVFMSILARL